MEEFELATGGDLTRALKAIAADGWTVTEVADGTRVLESSFASVSLLIQVDDVSALVVRAKVCDVPADADKVALYEDLLAGNFFWRATDGAALSLSGDSIYLVDSRETADFPDLETFRDFLECLVRQILNWRERVALSRRPGEEAR